MKRDRFIATAEAQVPPDGAGWVRFNLNAKLQAGRFYYVWLPATEKLQWHLYPTEIKGTARAYGGDKWISMPHSYKYRLIPGGEPVAKEDSSSKSNQLLPANVVNGWNRAVHGVPNSWAPKKGQSDPQWVELDFGRPVDFQ